MSVKMTAARETAFYTIAQGIVIIGLVSLCYVFFQGLANILNAFFVPLTLYAFSKDKRMDETIPTFVVLLLFVAVFFKLQLIFTLFYCAIALLLELVLQEERHTLISTLTVSLALSLGFWVSIVLTDDVFRANIYYMTLHLLSGNTFAYAILLWVEGFFVSVGLLYYAEKISVFLTNLNASKDSKDAPSPLRPQRQNGK